MDEFDLGADGQQRLRDYFELIGEVLGGEERRASYAVYAMGLFGDGDRKSMEPIAARADPNTRRVNAQHQRIQHFITNAGWSDREVRRLAAQHGIEALLDREPVTHLIIDDTGFLKQGLHSVGVKRQYTGSAGKVTNCQVGVSLSVATWTQHLPIDFELYLPREWTDDDARRREARIPDEIVFKTKLELAMEMIDRALEDGVPPGMVLVDSAYGTSTRFRNQLRERGLSYGVAVTSLTKVWRLDATNRRVGGRTLTVAEYARKLFEQGAFRKTTWREGSGGKLSARFAARRVLPIADEGIKRAEREPLWLLMEWENGKAEPSKYHLVSLPPQVSIKALVRNVKQRWRTERAYEDMKGQLGLDHFEGRRYRGWHHHVSAVLTCYAFIIAEHARHFPPAPGATHQACAHVCAA
jgi:SRSO17 transposase